MLAPTMSFAPPQTDRDAEVANPPTDSISSMAFSPTADLLAVGSWSNEVSTFSLLYRIFKKSIHGTRVGGGVGRRGCVDKNL